MVRRTVLAALLVAAALAGGARAQLKEGFYDYSCPQAEKIVKDYVKAHIPHAPDVASTLLRTHFHDCFVRGCDASVLLNATGGSEAEKDAAPNLTLRGFGFIDRIKALLEKECPGVVSCADIVALAARDSVGVIGGPFWSVPTGRRDGTVSIKQEALDQIPAPTMNFTQLLQSFQNKSLNLADLVWLSGAHTIGISQCNSFSERLYNFTGRGGPDDADPSLDPLYAAKLRLKCKTLTDNTTIVEMDPGSFRTFDLSYYRGVLKRRGLFQSDAALITDAASKADILSVINAPPEVFFQVFAGSMVKMGAIEVKTGSEGEIRKHCALVNKH
ncbi:Peroxidase 3 [Zea mays]|uniref:Peroxidase n=2 Tax=Zea mays TaxID=4577 RepID=B6THU9_MAIZE|nr:peroxidase 39 precursor [Zea mays]ACG36682.1 peroxidase 39 precursor [Zea mays]AQK66332.1 Peroxidase 3 [Zea mays]PWZ20923.1 Peroxidase 3 [Zea mays]|eukprot:NP_001149755.1 peroxidase 39 precursor [Zea mays]